MTKAQIAALIRLNNTGSIGATRSSIKSTLLQVGYIVKSKPDSNGIITLLITDAGRDAVHIPPASASHSSPRRSSLRNCDTVLDCLQD